MASRNSTPSRSRSSSNSSSLSDATMMDAPPHPHSPSRPARLRNPSHGAALPTPTPTAPLMHATSARPDPSFSLLLSLPRELRDRIYAYALVSKAPFWWPGTSPQSPPTDRRNAGVALLRTSKRVYNEAVDILYAHNKFLFTHPSDCNIFRVVAAPASLNITSLYFRIKEKDLKLWTAYLGSKHDDRSLKSDFPKLKNLWVFLKCGAMGLPVAFAALQPGPAAAAAAPPPIGHHLHALHHQIQMAQAAAAGGAHAHPGGNQLPPPPPPAPAMPFLQFAQGALGLGAHHGQHHHHHPQVTPHFLTPQHPHAHMHPQTNPPHPPLFHAVHHFGSAPDPQALSALPPTHSHETHAVYAAFLRFERELGVESLCLNLSDVLRPSPSSALDLESSASSSGSTGAERFAGPFLTKPQTEARIICILRIPRPDLERLVALYPDELSVDARTQDARTRFRKLHGLDVSLELNGYPALDHDHEERD
ncbi:hypothetical protein ACJBU6_04563 [Exserohilum turcicum]